MASAAGHGRREHSTAQTGVRRYVERRSEPIPSVYRPTCSLHRSSTVHVWHAQLSCHTLSVRGRHLGRLPWMSHRRTEEMVRAVADRAFLPVRGTCSRRSATWSSSRARRSSRRSARRIPYGGEFVSQFLFALKLCWFPLLDHDVRVLLRRRRVCRRRTSSSCSARSTGSAASSCSRSIREFAPFVICAIIARRRRRDGDHGGPRRAQDPRGAGRAAGARRRPGQEPRRAALPRADARDRPVRRLRAAVRHLRRHRRDARQRRAARPLLRDLLHERLDDRPVGLAPEVARCSGRSSRSSAATRA